MSMWQIANAAIKCAIESYEFAGETGTGFCIFYSIFTSWYLYDLGESHSCGDTFQVCFTDYSSSI